MNRDYLEDFVKIATGVHGEVYKLTENDKIINHCWLHENWSISNRDYEKIASKVQEYINTRGWVITPAEHTELHGEMIIQSHTYGTLGTARLPGFSNICKTFFTILYDKEKDKISLSMYQKGYGYSTVKGRLYPISRNTPLMCFSKHIYAFKAIRKGRRLFYKPRIYTGLYHRQEFVPYLKHVLDCSDQVLEMYVPYRHMKGCSGKAWAFIRAYGFGVEHLLHVLKMDGDHNRLISLGGKRVKELCNAIIFRLEEKATKGDMVHSTMDLFNETTKLSYPRDILTF